MKTSGKYIDLFSKIHYTYNGMLLHASALTDFSVRAHNQNPLKRTQFMCPHFFYWKIKVC